MQNFSKPRLLNLRLLGATALAFALINSLGISFCIEFGQSLTRHRPNIQGSLDLQGNLVEARVSSGGRSRGGSFSRPSSSRSSSSRSSSSSNSGSPGSSSSSYSSPARRSYDSGGYGYANPGYSNPGYANPGYSNPGYSNPGYSNSGNDVLIILLFGIGGMIGLIVCIVLLSRAIRRAGQNSGTSTGEGFDPSMPKALQNNIVTVTQLQVALLAQASEIQARLSELTANADTTTPEGLAELLREAVLALLRSPENWTHVRTSSQTLKDRESAAQLLEQLSITERSKFTAETLVNVGGKVRRRAIATENTDPAAYIVVTLLLGTEDDRPLLGSIHSTEELKGVLNRLGTVTPEYLSVFELLWSPQDAADSLTPDELLAEYADLKQLI